MSINLSSYSTLTNYAMLAATTMTTVNTTTVTNGLYGTVNSTYTGPFVGTPEIGRAHV